LLSDEELCKLDLYAFIEVSPDATKAVIKKAYKKKAKELHPDKNPDNPKAGDLFDHLKKVSEFLQDDSKREKYDKYRQQQELRKRKLEEEDSGRKNLRKELERREEAYRLSKLNDQKLTEAEKARFQTERLIEELSKQGHFHAPSEPVQAPPTSDARNKSRSLWGAPSSSSTTAASFSAASDARNKSRTLFASSTASSTAPLPTSSSSTTVIVSWEHTRPKEWREELGTLLGKYGEVTDLIVKKKKAVAVFATAKQAALAVSATLQGLTLGLKPMLVVVDDDEPSSPETPAKKPSLPTPVPRRNADTYENDTLELLRQRQMEKAARERVVVSVS